VSKRRVEENLLKADGGFTPITMAKPTETSVGVQDLYKDILGQTLFSKKFRNAEQAVINPIRRIREMSKVALDVTKADADEALRIVRREAAERADDIGPKFKERTRMAKEGNKEVLQTINTSKANTINRQEGIIASKVDDAIEAQASAFRRKILSDAMPDTSLNDEIGSLLNLGEPKAAKAGIDELWKRRGFASIHNNTFQFKTDSIAAKLSTESGEGAYGSKGEVLRVANEVLEDLIGNKNAGGRIDGTTLAKIRSG